MIRKAILEHGGFEKEALDPWQPWKEGFLFAPGEGVGGTDAIRCVSGNPLLEYGAAQRIILNQECPRALFVAGSSRAQDVDDPLGSGYSLYVDLTYQDGTHLWAQFAPFATGSHDWQRQELLIHPEKPVKELWVYALFRGHVGTVWFDDFVVEEWTPSEGSFLFDRLPVLFGPASVDGSWEGRILLRDVKNESHLYGLGGWDWDWEGEGEGETWTARCETLDLEVRVVRSERKEGLSVDLLLRDVAEKIEDRFVSLYVTAPVPPGTWTWHDDMRRSRQVDCEEMYGPSRSIDAGTHGHHSLYPLGVLSDEHGFLALGVPPNLPRYYRIFYHESLRWLVLAFDVALSPVPRRFPRCADFQAITFSGQGKHGFRSALEVYYRLYQEHFEKRVLREGLWMPFTDIATVPRFEDFHFAFQEGAPNPGWDEVNGVMSFPYVEPMTHWIALPEEIQRTREGAMEFLDSLECEEGAATRISSAWNQRGDPWVEVLKAPWCDGCVFTLNANPDLPDQGDHKASGPLRLESLLGKIDRSGEAGQDGELDGVYVDSLEGWKHVKNFRPSHLPYAKTPLLFDPAGNGPFEMTIYSTYAFCQRLQEEMRKRDKYTFANAALWEFAFLAPLFDILGTETNWKPNARWEPDSDEIFCFRRSLCYQKPYCLLQNTDFDSWSRDDTERYILRCLFYACFPGMFSQDASTRAYFTEPSWYERDRDLFAGYMPWIRVLAQAGWEPVTHAWEEGKTIWLERYGPTPQGLLYLTALNPSVEERHAVFQVDVTALGARDASLLNRIPGVALDPVQGTDAEESLDLIRFVDTLTAEEVRLYELQLIF